MFNFILNKIICVQFYFIFIINSTHFNFHFSFYIFYKILLLDCSDYYYITIPYLFGIIIDMDDCLFIYIYYKSI
jgi:hypothetical protein